jgi:hypothetical protein
MGTDASLRDFPGVVIPSAAESFASWFPIFKLTRSPRASRATGRGGPAGNFLRRGKLKAPRGNLRGGECPKIREQIVGAKSRASGEQSCRRFHASN